MDFWQFLKLYGPLAAIGGTGYALVRQMFLFAWRLAKVEERGERHEVELSGLQTPIDRMGKAVARIEAQLEDMQRRHR